MSSMIIGNALRATCHHQQKVLNKSVGAWTNNLSMKHLHGIRNGKGIAIKVHFFSTRCVNDCICIINTVEAFFMRLYLMPAVNEVSRLDSI